MLSAVESTATQHLRLTLARQLAEVLLRGKSEHTYNKPFHGKSDFLTYILSIKQVIYLNSSIVHINFFLVYEMK